ncbi:unnamed protein product [Blepharisma stoltei]|uniref:Glucosamine 6-phosphate N-acetyltransferase n=1 Tax=Blepharisma stoltei TaxID=1481888 RepID=A0AAU9ISU1_9CILI|nr:unnamed protein product [Blepharisma stoltei]
MENVLQPREIEGIVIRRLESGDFQKGIIELLSTLTKVGNLTEEIFCRTLSFMNSRPNEYYVIVFEDLATQKLVAHGTLLVEQKLLYEGGKCGHIEDVVVAKNCQGRGIGKQLVTFLVNLSRELGCYKVILDCKDEIKGFYEICGLEQRFVCMAKYHMK